MSKSKKFNKPGNLKSEPAGTNIDNPRFWLLSTAGRGTALILAYSIFFLVCSIFIWLPDS